MKKKKIRAFRKIGRLRHMTLAAFLLFGQNKKRIESKPFYTNKKVLLFHILSLDT